MSVLELVELLALCNNLGCKKYKDWPEISNLPVLERQAAKLKSPEEAFILVDGEESDIMCLVDDLDIEELHHFLNKVFNDQISILV